MSAQPVSVRSPVPALRLLGPVQVTGARGPRPDAAGRATELVAFLALHPWATCEPLDAALWPYQRVTDMKRNGPGCAARRWLGEAVDGHPYVCYVSEGGYALAPEVRTDWQDFQSLVPEVSVVGRVPTERLRAALRLVTGPPLSGVNAARYAWAELDRATMVEAVAVTAGTLAQRAARAGDHRTASWAAAVGLTADPADERLWRQALRAARATGDAERLRQVRARARVVLDTLGALDPRTEALLRP